mgnify:CR=1 FL=1
MITSSTTGISSITVSMDQAPAPNVISMIPMMVLVVIRIMPTCTGHSSMAPFNNPTKTATRMAHNA